MMMTEAKRERCGGGDGKNMMPSWLGVGVETKWKDVLIGGNPAGCWGRKIALIL